MGRDFRHSEARPASQEMDVWGGQFLFRLTGPYLKEVGKRAEILTRGDR